MILTISKWKQIFFSSSFLKQTLSGAVDSSGVYVKESSAHLFVLPQGVLCYVVLCKVVVCKVVLQSCSPEVRLVLMSPFCCPVKPDYVFQKY